jgi:hypothetical protein
MQIKILFNNNQIGYDQVSLSIGLKIDKWLFMNLLYNITHSLLAPFVGV